MIDLFPTVSGIFRVSQPSCFQGYIDYLFLLTLFPIVYLRLDLVYRIHLDGHRHTSLSYFLFLSGSGNRVLSGLECVLPENKSQNVPHLISQHPVQSVGGTATQSLSSQSLHLHIVLTQPLTGRHLLESAANTTCEKIGMV